MTKNTVQVKNPKTNRYVKIDKTKGIIVSHKKTPGPYKNVAIAKKGGSQVNKELEALRVLKANAILFDDGTDFGASMLEAISDLEKALTPPTADEVCKALSEYFDEEVIEIETTFSFKNKDFNHRLIATQFRDKSVKIFYHLVPRLNIIINGYYKGLERDE